MKPAEKEIVLGDACRTPVRVLGPAAPTAPVAIVFHGLAASAAIMEPIGQSLAEAGWRVYLLDLAGHGRSRESFSYARADQCAVAAVEFLHHSGQLVPRRTIYVGHSLGAAVVLHLASVMPVAATVAISPALVIPPKRAPPNLLVLAGEFDFRLVRKTARQILRNADGTRDKPSDFAHGRAVAFGILSGELHGTMVLDPRAWTRIVEWAGRALAPGGFRPATARSHFYSMWLPLAALISNLLLLAGMVLFVGPVLTAVADLARLDPSRQTTESDNPSPHLAWGTILVQWTVAAFSTVCLVGLLRLNQFIQPVRMDDGDWTALIALLTGVVLLVLLRRAVEKELAPSLRWLNFALIAGIVLVVLFSWAVRPELVESSLSGARIWRWAVLACFTFPYFLAEEGALGPPGGMNRFLKFLAMRGLLFLAGAFAVLIFWPSGLLIVLLAIGLALVSIGQRLASDVLRQRGAGVAASAVFDAILAAGMLALILPLI